MRPRRKRPRPAMSEAALTRFRERSRARLIRIFAAMERQGETIDWTPLGGRPPELDSPPAGDDRGPDAL